MLKLLKSKIDSIFSFFISTKKTLDFNILKFLNMASSSNFGNVFSIIGASALLPFLPMKSLQIVTQNFLYDVSQIAIPLDNVDSSYLKKPHRWSPNNIARFMLWMGPVSSLFDYATFAALKGNWLMIKEHI